MKRGWIRAFGVAAVGLAASTFAAGDTGESPRPKRKLLLYSLTKGFHHGSTEVLEAELPKLGQESGAFECTVTENPDDLKAQNLAKYDAIFFFTTGDVLPTPELRKTVSDFVKSGRGIIGAHNATDSLYNWEEWAEIMGGYFDGHPWNQEVGFKVEDASHPAIKSLPVPFKFKEEIYVFKNFSRERVHVLMSVDTSTVDVNKAKGRTDFPFVWCREYGKGRVFYTGFGHHDECWKDETMMKKHILPAIQWVMGDVKWTLPRKTRR